MNVPGYLSTTQAGFNQTLEEACKSAEARLEECGRDCDQRLADTAARLQAASEAQTAAQTALAATEANFRVAVQVQPASMHGLVEVIMLGGQNILL